MVKHLLSSIHSSFVDKSFISVIHFVCALFKLQGCISRLLSFEHTQVLVSYLS